ncbi:toxin CfTX-A-like [Mya arenaria]|uniref:toxin CfTX-A-like n=1 Tax=Mya arenaria TaxID=6604 RepID=UPI0022E0BD92|nr:toxin CfTX-A-like [Mya arenaria]
MACGRHNTPERREFKLITTKMSFEDIEIIFLYEPRSLSEIAMSTSDKGPWMLKCVKERSECNNADRVKQAMEYTKLYITLAVLRSALLWEMYALVQTVPDFDWSADAIQRVALLEDKHDKDFIEYLTKPYYSKAVFFAYFNPSQWPVIITFLEKKGLSYQRYDHLAHGSHSLRTEKWRNRNMFMWDDRYGTIGGTDGNVEQASRFYFDPIQPKDNIFHIRSVKWPKWFVFMIDEEEAYCFGTEVPGPDGEWKIVRFDDGKYMLSPRKWPEWFIYMINDDCALVRGVLNDSGIQGHWIID